MIVRVGELTGSVTLNYVLVVEPSKSTFLAHVILRNETDNVHAQEYVHVPRYLQRGLND